jgi:enoyl-CoA hydratase/carnithine racemase
MSTELKTLLVERSEGVVTVTLNRPARKNAVNDVMWRELLTTFSEISTNEGDRVMVVTGAGGAFCSGADLAAPADDAGSPREPFLTQMRAIGEVALCLHRFPKPTIAKVRGVAVGAGMSLALGCDLIVASDDARFSEIFAKRGLSVDFGSSWLLPRLIGLHRAKELAYFGDLVSAEQAVEFGFVNHIVPSAELDDFVSNWATRLAAGPPLALSMTKAMFNNSFSLSMDQALEDEARSQAVNFSLGDSSEALQAFVEKRSPIFKGR